MGKFTVDVDSYNPNGKKAVIPFSVSSYLMFCFAHHMQDVAAAMTRITVKDQVIESAALRGI